MNDSKIELYPPPPPKEILKIVPTGNGFDIVIPDDITLTEAAKLFIIEVKKLLGQFND